MATTSRSRTMGIAVVLLALGLLLAACGSSSKSSTSSASGSTGSSSALKATLNGSGSTFQKTFDEAAIQGFTSQNSGVTINYAGGGSGKGKTDLQTKTVDFAGTDSTIKPEDVSKYQGGEVLYFPTVAAPITVSYNVNGVDKLQLSADTIANIFQGNIKKWNDAAIAKDNPGVTLPDTDITIVHRADASGTTSNFTKFLAAAAPTAWKLESGDSINWPSGSQAGQGNTGVASAVKGTDGAIGYVDYSDAVASGLKFAAVKNSKGEFVEATLDGAAKAVEAAKINPDLTYNPINSDGAGAYPITSPTWIIAYAKQTDKAKGDALHAFINYLLTDGQSLAADAKYAALPASLRDQAVANLQKLQIPTS